jgi:hypothetical protein
LARRYRMSNRVEKGRILDEFVAIAGFHRKHAMRLLRCDPDGQTAGQRNRPRIYQDAERNALILLWKAADRVCGKRLKALLPILIESMERHGHIDLAPEIRSKLLSMSAATIDRTLRCVREQSGRQRGRSVGSALRRSITVRTSADCARFRRGRCCCSQRSFGARQFRPCARPVGRNARHFWCANRSY